MRLQQTYDVCEISWIYSQTKNAKIPRWASTPVTNVSYAIARRKKQVFEVDPNRRHATYIIVNNGENPLKRLVYDRITTKTPKLPQ